MSYCSGGKLEVTEKELIEIQIAHLQGQIKEKQKKLEELSKTKSPIEEAYKDWWGYYPTDTWEFGGDRWDAFQAGYNAAYKEPEENEWKSVALRFGEKLSGYLSDGYYELSPAAWFRWAVFTYGKGQQIKETVRESVKWCEENPDKDPLDWLKSRDDFMDKMVAELKGKTLTDLIWKWWEDVFTTHEEWDAENAIEELVNRIEQFLPKEQSANSQNAYVESAVEGFNDALNKIKRKLR